MGTPAKSNPDYYTGTIPWVTPKDMKCWEILDAKEHITALAVDESATKLIPAHAILVVARSGVLKHTLPVALNRVPVTINQDMKALVCGDRVCSDYLARYIKHASPVLLGAVRATTADNFPLDVLRSLPVPLPPLDEQRRIAAILDKADAVRRKRLESRALLNDLLRSAFVDMFGDPTSNAPRWPEHRFSDLLVKPLRNGLSPDSKGTVTAEVLTLAAITGDCFRPTAVKTGLFLVEPPEAKLVRRDELLICRGNGNLDLVGRAKTSTVSIPATVFPDTMIAAHVDSKQVDLAYIQALWDTSFVRGQIVRGARTTNGTHKINQQVLETLVIPCPPLTEQRRFRSVMERVAALRARCDPKLAEDLFASLVLRAFSGELV